MENSKISVIIPVYKVEKYLSKCLDSVINQTYKNLEIILVDDGSPDKSGEICDEYASRDERIKVIHKENGGVSAARNAALDVMSGDYVTFVDSDDFLKNTLVERVLFLMENNDVDVVQIELEKNSDDIDTPTAYDNSPVLLVGDDNLKNLVLSQKIRFGVPGKLFRTKIFEDLRFDENLKYAEDFEIQFRLYKIADKSLIVNEKLYFYRNNLDGLTNVTLSPGQLHEPDMILKMITGENDCKWLYDCLISRYMLCVLGLLHKAVYNKRADLYAELRKRPLKYKKDIFRNPNLKVKHKLGLVLLCCCRSFKIYSFFINTFYNIKDNAV